jgi:hypothetical protein
VRIISRANLLYPLATAMREVKPVTQSDEAIRTQLVLRLRWSIRPFATDRSASGARSPTNASVRRLL